MTTKTKTPVNQAKEPETPNQSRPTDIEGNPLPSQDSDVPKNEDAQKLGPVKDQTEITQQDQQSAPPAVLEKKVGGKNRDNTEGKTAAQIMAEKEANGQQRHVAREMPIKFHSENPTSPNRGKITSAAQAQELFDRDYAAPDGDNLAYVLEDGNVFYIANESAAIQHARLNGLRIFEVVPKAKK